MAKKQEKQTARGEVLLTLDGTTYTLRPTFEALVAIEASVGKEITAIGLDLDQRRYSVKTVVDVLYHAIRAAKPTPMPTYSEVGEAVVRAGFGNVLNPIVQYLVAAIDPRNRENEGGGGDDAGQGE